MTSLLTTASRSRRPMSRGGSSWSFERNREAVLKSLKMETKQIKFYDSENDVFIETTVSVADARRAETDIEFATQLLRAVQSEDLLSSGGNNACQPHGDEPDVSDLGDFDPESHNNEINETSLYRWSTPSVLLFLETYRSMETILHSGKSSHKKVWDDIAEVLNKNKYQVTGPQCSSKLRSLKKTFKSIKDHNNKSGNDRRTWQFYDIMDEIFGKKAWSNPVAVASSTGLSVRNSESQDNVDESDSGVSTNSSKSTITSLLGKRLKQKEEHEENRIKRHKEKMEMDEKILAVLEKLANK